MKSDIFKRKINFSKFNFSTINYFLKNYNLKKYKVIGMDGERKKNYFYPWEL